MLEASDAIANLIEQPIHLYLQARKGLDNVIIGILARLFCLDSCLRYDLVGARLG